MSLPRETLKWILSLDLSYPVKNVRRDFANGFLFAEVLSRYYPADVHMHSFENVASSTRKKQNWQLLEKLIKRKQIPVEKSQIQAVMAAEEDAAVEMLQVLHAFIHSPAFSAGDPCGPPPASNYTHMPDQGYAAEAMAQPSWAYQGNNLPPQAPAFIPLHQPIQPAYQQPAPQQVLYPQQPATGGYAMQHMYGYQPEQFAMPGMYPQQQQQQQQHLSGMYSDQGGYSGPISGGQQAHALRHEYSQPATSQPANQKQRQAATVAKPAVARQAAKAPKASGKAAEVHAPQLQSQPSHVAAPAHEVMNPYSMMQGDGMMYGQMDMPWGQPSYAAGGGYAGGYAAAFGQQQQQAAYHGQYAGNWMDMGQQLQGGAGLERPASDADNGPFSKRRPMEYQPYDMKDFEDKAYNVKKAGNRYWELGRLGPDLETPELQEKREKAEKLKALAAQVREDNMKKAAVAAAKPRKEAPKEPTARDKALEFAKNVPKPEPGKADISPPASGAKAAGALGYAAAGRLAAGAASKTSASKAGRSASPSPLQLLEAQHAADRQKVEAIRAELARLL